MIELAAFLGNPGTQYRNTRHNLGRMVLGAMPQAAGLSWRGKFHGRTATLAVGAHGNSAARQSRQVTLLVPEVYMNHSGKSVGAAYRFMKLSPQQLLVVHDELELPYGTADVRAGGGYGGNNGLKSVGAAVGSPDFYRLRAGIGRPERGSVSSHVLSAFSAEQAASLSRYCEALAEIVMELLQAEPERTASRITKKPLL